MVEGSHIGRENIFRYDDPFLPQLGPRPVTPFEAVDDAAADVLHVGRPLPQVGVLHGGKCPDIMFYHFIDGTDSTIIALDQFNDLAAEAPVFQDHEMGMEDGGIFFREELGNPFLHVDGLDLCLFQGHLEALLLLRCRQNLHEPPAVAAQPLVEDVDLSPAEPR